MKIIKKLFFVVFFSNFVTYLVVDLWVISSIKTQYRILFDEVKIENTVGPLTLSFPIKEVRQQTRCVNVILNYT